VAVVGWTKIRCHARLSGGWRGWDDALLAEDLAWLRDERFDLDLIGFDASELERLLALADGETASEEADDEVPEPPEEPVSPTSGRSRGTCSLTQRTRPAAKPAAACVRSTFHEPGYQLGDATEVDRSKHDHCAPASLRHEAAARRLIGTPPARRWWQGYRMSQQILSRGGRGGEP
jgi:hypothetical protein